MALVEAWNSHADDGQKVWLASDKRDPVRQEDMKLVETFTLSIGPVERAIRELNASRPSLSWL